MAKLTFAAFVGLSMILVGCGSGDKDVVRDLPDPVAKPGHGRTHKPIPALVEIPGAKAVDPGSKSKGSN